MIIINDFFARNVEAVSYQMELCLKAIGEDSKIVGAKTFFNQKILSQEDIKDNIYIYPFKSFYKNLKLELSSSTDNRVFIFEEEPSKEKLDIINESNKDVYIFMYRQPFKGYIEYIKKYKRLKKVFVEMDSHKQILLENGFKNEDIVVAYTPSRFEKSRNKKKFNPNKITLLFASWNNDDKIDTCYIRGLFWLVDCVEKYKNIELRIILRDNNTKVFKEYVKAKNVNNRVKLLKIKNMHELKNEFDNADLVVYFLLMQIIKDVPNSLIDGIMRGKPVIMTDVLSFSNEVKRHNLGIVIKPNGALSDYFKMDIKQYNTFSKNVSKYADKHSPKNFAKTIRDNLI